jgi:carbonic anhydrase/acetyltransferase-like protein (isoleucine patch superfamily)
MWAAALCSHDVSGYFQLAVGGRGPRIDPTAWVAPGAYVIGDVSVGPRSSVWYGAVIRADQERIEVGCEVNIQDGCVLHADPGLPLLIGDGVTVGHGVTLHGCRIEDSVLIGMGAVVLNAAAVGAGSIVGAGAVVSEGTIVPPGSLVLGVPGRVVRPTGDAERESIGGNARSYVGLSAIHRGAWARPGNAGRASDFIRNDDSLDG